MANASMSFLDSYMKKIVRPLITYLKAFPAITPNRISIFSLLFGITLIPLCIIHYQNFRLAATCLIIVAVLDNIDGELARATSTQNGAGALLDASVDRILDFVTLSSLIIIFPRFQIIGLCALLGTSLVPYIQAKASVYGIGTLVTIGDSASRMVILIVSFLFNMPVLSLILLAILTPLGATRRFYQAYTMLTGNR